MGYKKHIRSEINRVIKHFEGAVPGILTYCDNCIVTFKSEIMNIHLHYADSEFIILNIEKLTNQTWSIYRVFYRYNRDFNSYSKYKTVWYYDRSLRNKRKTLYHDDNKEIYYDYNNNHCIKVIDLSGDTRTITYKDHYNTHYKLAFDKNGKVGISLTGGPIYEDLGKFIYKAVGNKDLIRKLFEDFSKVNK